MQNLTKLIKEFTEVAVHEYTHPVTFLRLPMPARPRKVALTVVGFALFSPSDAIIRALKREMTSPPLEYWVAEGIPVFLCATLRSQPTKCMMSER